MSDDPKILAAIATVNGKLDGVIQSLKRINGSVGKHEDIIHELDTRTAINSEKIDAIEKQPNATKAVILMGSITGVLVVAATLIMKFT